MYKYVLHVYYPSSESPSFSSQKTIVVSFSILQQSCYYTSIVFIPSLMQSITIFSAFSKLTPFSSDIHSDKHLLIATSNVNKLSVLPAAFTFAFLYFIYANIIPKIYFSFFFQFSLFHSIIV